jgi:hypothetical protein
LYEQCLNAWRRVLGPEHPTTIRTISELANLLRTQGKYDAADQLFVV